MTDNKVLLGAAAVGAAVGFFAAQKLAKGPSGFGARVGKAAKSIEQLTPAEASAFIKQASPLILDVRDSGDAANGIQGAINIPLSNLVFAADQSFVIGEDIKVKGEVKVPKGTAFCHDKLKGNKNKPILVSCGLGGQAAIAAEILVDYGFTNVKAVDGGNMAWMNFGGAVCDCLK